MSRQKLSNSEVEALMQDMDGWALTDGEPAIRKVFKFSGFAEAFGFMTECALFAEKTDHHPEWSNVYRTVEVKLNTHSAKGLTQLDFDLAAVMDKASGRR